MTISGSVIGISCLCQSAHCDTWNGTRADKGDIRANDDSSVANYSATDYTPFFDYARAQWSSISSKVNILKSTTTLNTPDKYYVGSDDLGYGFVGLTQFYYKGSTGVIQDVSSTPDHDVTYETVSIYDLMLRRH